MNKKLIALALAIIMLMSITACSIEVKTDKPAETAAPTPAPTETLQEKQEVAEKTADVSNPVNTVADYKSLTSAQPTIKINDAPAGSTNISYAWINNIPAIDQIDFTIDGHTYCYRAASCPNGTASVDISGVNDSVPAVSTVEVNKENEASGSYVLRYDPETGKGVTNWTSKVCKTQYSLYSADACKGKVEEMPMTKVMEQLFNCTQDAKTVSGTAAAVNKNVITFNPNEGDTVVVNCENIKKLTIEANDKIDILYMGEVDVDAEVVRITKTGTAEPKKEGSTFSGRVFRYDSPNLFVQTDDNNVFLFQVNNSTTVTGAASALAANQDVVVTYTGDLYNNPVAVSVNVTKVNPAPTPVPVPVPTYNPGYKDGSLTGVVTNVCGIWITVNGVLFEVNGANCYISGEPQVGGYATINYRDFGNGNLVVTSAHFYNYVPTPAPQKTLIWSGNIDAVSGTYVTVDGKTFNVNTYNVEGTPQVGGFARIDYIDHGYGYLEVTYARFSAPDPEPEYRPGGTDFGVVTSYNGKELTLSNGNHYYIEPQTSTGGYYTPGCTAGVAYNLYKDGTPVAISITFHGTPGPEQPVIAPAPDPEPVIAPAPTVDTETAAVQNLTEDENGNLIDQDGNIVGHR